MKKSTHLASNLFLAASVAVFVLQNQHPHQSIASTLLTPTRDYVCPIFILSPLTKTARDKVFDFIQQATSSEETTSRCEPVVYAQFDTLRCNENPQQWAEVCQMICATAPDECKGILPNQFNMHSSNIDYWEDGRCGENILQSFLDRLQATRVRMFVYPTELAKNPAMKEKNQKLFEQGLRPDSTLAHAAYKFWNDGKGNRAQPIFDTVAILDFLTWALEGRNLLSSLPVAHRTRTPVLAPEIQEQCERTPRDRPEVCEMEEYVLYPESGSLIHARLPASSTDFNEFVHRHACELQSLFGVESEDCVSSLLATVGRPPNLKRILVLQDGPDADNLISLKLLDKYLSFQQTDRVVIVGRPVNFEVKRRARELKCGLGSLDFSSSPMQTGSLTWPALKPGACPELDQHLRGRQNRGEILDSERELGAVTTLFQAVFPTASVEQGGFGYVMPLHEILHTPQLASFGPSPQHMFCCLAFREGLEDAPSWCVDQNSLLPNDSICDPTHS